MNPPEIRRTVIETLLLGKGNGSCMKAVEDGTPLGAGGLGVSSLALLQTFVKLEDRFGMTFDDGSVAVAKFATVGELVTFVGRALGQPESTEKMEV